MSPATGNYVSVHNWRAASKNLRCAWGHVGGVCFSLLLDGVQIGVEHSLRQPELPPVTVFEDHDVQVGSLPNE